jgi:NADPH2:quinone reductase
VGGVTGHPGRRATRQGGKGERATICLDTVGGPVLDAAVAAMDDEGRLVNIATPGDGTITFNLRRFFRANLTLRGLNTAIYDVIDGARVLEALADGFAAGRLQPPRIAAAFPLPQARKAYALAASRPNGKVVLDAHQFRTASRSHHP